MSITLEVTQTLLRAVEETTPLDVMIESRPVRVEVDAGTPLSDSIAAALNAANDPSASNPFATMDDVAGVIPDGISGRVLLGAADDTVTTSPSFTRNVATGSVANQATGDLAPGLVGTATGAGAPGVKGSSVEGDGVQGVGSGPSSAGVRGTGTSGYGVVGSSTAGVGGVFSGPIGASVGALTDDGTALNISKGNIALPPGRTVDGVDISELSEVVLEHSSADDPHGDRAYTTSQIATHAADSSAHRNYARIFMMGA